MTTPVAPRADAGHADTAGGAGTIGTGSGAVGEGHGTGAGLGGDGPGAGGGAAPTVKIAGDINAASDYPRSGRARRAGASVIIDLTVGPDGRVDNCRVVQPSPDPEADAITCRLATQRFIFRPARGPSGEPVRAIYRWRQRWFS
ncbi:TonB family protein [Novosphingobium sp. Leaf2]|uniref:TonB family protein n=1 Tax=Novosphingobium sp. Leaf2 TaxID=1735670 RepID=UPI001F48AF10|nr:TonB family protein [Novosphingobium sp. Leaf2]